MNDEKSISELKLSEEKYRILSETSKDIIINYGLDGKLTYVNKAGLAFSGLTNENYLGRDLTEFIPQESRKIVKDNIKERLEGFLEPRCYEMDFVDSTGIRRTFEVNSSPILNNGEIISFFSSAKDITDKKRQEHINKILYNITNAIIETIDLKDFIQVLHNELNKIVDATNFFIAFYDEKSGMLSAPFVSDEADKDNIWPAEKSLTGIVVRENKSLLLKTDDINNIYKTGKAEVIGRLAACWLGVALHAKGKVIGAFVVQSYTNENAYNIEDLKILEYISQQISIAIQRKRDEQQLNISQQTYQNILDSITEAVYILDENGVFLEVNKTAEKMYGYSHDFFIGKTPEFVSAPGKNDLEKVAIALNKAYNGEPQFLEFWGLKKDGSIFPKEVNCSSGNFFGKKVIISVARDITEKFKAKDELKRTQEQYFQLVENAVDAIFHGNAEGKFIGVNPRACEMTGFSKEELLNMTMNQLFTAEEVNQKPLRYDLLIQGQIVRTERRLTKKDGSLLPIEMNTKMMPDKTYQSFFRDFSERKQMEEELIKAKEKAEENEKLKSAFLANMSHEIRTPMNGIIGFAKLLKKASITPEQKDKYVDIINTSGGHLLNLINDIIDISKIDAKQLVINETDININKLINELYSIYYSQLILNSKTKIQLKSSTCLADAKAFIISDEIRLTQILNNLLNNATKFTEKGIIEFGYTIKDNEIIFYVKDSGIGISEEKQQVIFERFRQGDGNIEKIYGGTGLGLAISKACVELLGGKIWLNSTSYDGTTFYFSIPYKVSITNVVIDKLVQVNENGFENYTILIVEDDLINLMYLKELFEPYHINILEVNTGKEAVLMVKNNPKIDIILMDIQLPEMDGYEATKHIKLINSNIPVIIQTAYAFESDKQKSISAGCDGYISKPIDAEKLFDLIRRVKNK